MIADQQAVGSLRLVWEVWSSRIFEGTERGNLVQVEVSLGHTDMLIRAIKDVSM